MLTRYTAYLLENIFEPFVLALDAADNLGGDVLRGFKGLPDCSKNPVLQHIQASIFHYNTIGPHVVSIEIWPSTDSMYFEHYLCVLAATPIMWKTAISRKVVDLFGLLISPTSTPIQHYARGWLLGYWHWSHR
jgi:hypothetical protein